MAEHIKLVNKLQLLTDKLNDMFGSEYRLVHSEQPAPRLSHVTYVHHTYPWFYPWYPPSHNCNERKPTDDEDDDDIDYDRVTTTIFVGGFSLIATFVFATDGYVKLWRSAIADDIDEISALSQGVGKFNDVADAIQKLKLWIACYEQRTKHTFYSKLGIFGSGLAFGIAIYTKNKNAMTCFTATGIASGCYMLWNYLTADENHNTENVYFNEANASINNTKWVLSNIPPSAPNYNDLQTMNNLS
jgi:hypothetical protein